MKLAVVGTGIIGVSHLQAIEGCDQCTLCAICDVNEAVLRPLAEQYRVPYFTDYRDIVRHTDAEAVILNLPHWLHCEVTEFFLAQGLHVLVEKPMANTVAECDRMLAAAEKSGKKLAVGHMQRFLRANQLVKEIYDSAELGRLCMFEERRTIDYFRPNRPGWFFDRQKAGGGIVMNYGAHALDKLYALMGCCEISSVASSLGNWKNDASIEAHAQTFLKFKNGVSANITFSGYLGCGYETTYYFTEGALKVTGGVKLWRSEGKGWTEAEYEDDHLEMRRQLVEFIKFVNGEESAIATGTYAREILSGVERIYRGGNL